MENIETVNNGSLVDPNAQVTPDGGHQLLHNPNAQVTPDGGQTSIGHVPTTHVPLGHTVIGQFSVPFGQTMGGFGSTGVQTSVVPTPVVPIMATAPVVPTVPAVPAAHAEKPEKFNGTNFKRW